MTQFWNKARSEAFSLPLKELGRHAGVSIDNRHECQDCFCCACAAELRDRIERARAYPNDRAAIKRETGY